MTNSQLNKNLTIVGIVAITSLIIAVLAIALFFIVRALRGRSASEEGRDRTRNIQNVKKEPLSAEAGRDNHPRDKQSPAEDHWENMVFPLDKAVEMGRGTSFTFAGNRYGNILILIKSTNNNLEGEYAVWMDGLGDSELILDNPSRVNIKLAINSILLRDGGKAVCVYTKSGPVIFELAKTIVARDLFDKREEILGLAEERAGQGYVLDSVFPTDRIQNID